jgi:hypothetical protein
MPRTARILREETPPPPMNVDIIRERMMNNERAVITLQGEVREISAQMATQADVRAVINSVTGLSTKIDQIGRPQWTAISVGITVIVILGGLIYWPIREKQSDQAEILRMHDSRFERYMTRAEIEREWARRDQWTTRTDERLNQLDRETWSRPRDR